MDKYLWRLPLFGSMDILQRSLSFTILCSNSVPLTLALIYLLSYTGFFSNSFLNKFLILFHISFHFFNNFLPVTKKFMSLSPLLKCLAYPVS